MASLKEARKWPIHMLDALMNLEDPDENCSEWLLTVVKALNETSFSTCFSGMDAPGTALLEVHKAVMAVLRAENCKGIQYLIALDAELKAAKWAMDWE